jgi:hypothetical protein
VRGLVVFVAVQLAGCLPAIATVRVAPTRDARATLAQVQERAGRLKLPAAPTRGGDEILRYWGRAEYSETKRSDHLDASVRTADMGGATVVVATGRGD